MTFTVTLWRFTYSLQAWEPVATRTVGTVRAGELLADSWLEPHRITTTRDCYHRDTAHAAFVTIDPARAEKRYARECHRVEAKADIVPSVGELGYW